MTTDRWRARNDCSAIIYPGQCLNSSMSRVHCAWAMATFYVDVCATPRWTDVCLRTKIKCTLFTLLHTCEHTSHRPLWVERSSCTALRASDPLDIRIAKVQRTSTEFAYTRAYTALALLGLHSPRPALCLRAPCHQRLLVQLGIP